MSRPRSLPLLEWLSVIIWIVQFQQRRWQAREVLPGEYFPYEEAYKPYGRKRKPKSDSGERKVEE